MSRLSKLIGNLDKINYTTLIDECFVETEQVLIDLIRSQLAEGKNAAGDMPLYKSKSYARKKGIDRVNLELTGKFLSKLKVYQNKFSIRVRSTDSKMAKILALYSSASFELTPENYSIYITKYILPLFKTKFRNGLLS